MAALSPSSGRRLYRHRFLSETIEVLYDCGTVTDLWVRDDADPLTWQAGNRIEARYTGRNAGAAQDFAELDTGEVVAVSGLTDPRPTVGSSLNLIVKAPPRGDKRAVTRLASDDPAAPASEPEGAAEVCTGLEAETMTLEALEAALATQHPLSGGGTLSIEPTRALVAVDVDGGSDAGIGADFRRRMRRINQDALTETARLLRLKGLGGLVVIDLIGVRHDIEQIRDQARQAFAAFGPEAQIGPLSRFGLLELSLPWTRRPLHERFIAPDGTATPRAEVLRLARDAVRIRRSDPGLGVTLRLGRASGAVADDLFRTYAHELGPMIRFEVDPQCGPGQGSVVFPRLS